MLHTLAQGSPLVLAIITACFVLVLIFEFSNGFHDTANAVATVIYTNSLRPLAAVVWSGLLNFIGVLVGGIAVAYALVELIPPEVLTPPDGSTAAGMLVAVFAAALLWNVGTWWFGIPNSSSHALIGALIGVALEVSLSQKGNTDGVDWSQIWSVLGALLISPLLGLVLGWIVFSLMKRLVHRHDLYEPPHGDTPPVWWIRALLIATCTAVSFSHGTNDGQKSIGLIMLTIIGLMPATYGLNLGMTEQQIRQVAAEAPDAAELVARAGGERKSQAQASAHALGDRFSHLTSIADIPSEQRTAVRNDLNEALNSLRDVSESRSASEADKTRAKAIHDHLMQSVEYAPWWVRILSALCLGVGTMVGYRRIVKTLGERLGKVHLVPAQGASAELVAAGLIGYAGFGGYPVSTTHVVTGGIAGTMVASGAGLQRGTVTMIATAWVTTLPATIALSCGLFYLLR